MARPPEATMDSNTTTFPGQKGQTKRKREHKIIEAAGKNKRETTPVCLNPQHSHGLAATTLDSFAPSTAYQSSNGPLGGMKGRKGGRRSARRERATKLYRTNSSLKSTNNPTDSCATSALAQKVHHGREEGGTKHIKGSVGSDFQQNLKPFNPNHSSRSGTTGVAALAMPDIGSHHNQMGERKNRQKIAEKSNNRKRRRDAELDKTASGEKPYENAKISKGSLVSSTGGWPKKTKLPLNGYALSVSTLQGSTRGEIGKKSTMSSYQDACGKCRALGATVSELVSKHVHAVVCTQEAVGQATQRVRKAFKRNKPIVSMEWILACQTAGHVVDMEPYRLDEQAQNSIEKRNGQQSNEAASINGVLLGGKEEKDASNDEIDTGNAKSIDLGCCCVCHEQETGATDCPWCKDCQAK